MLTEYVQSNQYMQLSSRLKDLGWAFHLFDYQSQITGDYLANDPLLDTLVKHEYPSNLLYLPGILGRYAYAKDTDFIVHYGNLNSGYDNGFGWYDQIRTRAANWRNAKKLFTGDWNFTAPNSRDITGENSVLHVKPIGKVRSGTIPGGFIRTGDFVSPKVFHTSVNITTSSDGVSFTPEDFVLITTGPSGAIGNYLESLIAAYSGGTGVTATFSLGGSATGSVTSRNATVVEGNGSYVFTWEIFRELRYVGYPDGGTNVYSCSFHAYLWVPSIIPEFPDTPLPDGELALDSVLHRTATLSLTQTSSSLTGWVGSTVKPPHAVYNPGAIVTNYFPLPLYLFRHQDSFDGNVAGGGFSNVVERKIGTMYSSLTSHVKQRATDLAAISFYSTKDALDKAYPDVGVNILETLSDFSSVGELLSPQTGLQNFLRAVRKSKDGKTKIVALLDVLTDYKLLHDYGIAPTISDGKAIASKGRSLYKLYKSGRLFDEVSSHGKYVQTVPMDFGPFFDGITEVEITWRSVIRWKLNENTILAALMPAHMAGVMPSLANLWDLVQFSFVVDWFFGIGSRLESIDTSAWLLGLEIKHSVHSISFSVDIPAPLLVEHNVTTLLGSPPQIAFYLRTSLSDVPSLTRSSIDPSGANGPNDLLTAGSLAYKVMRR